MSAFSPIDLVADWHAKFGVGLPSAPTFTPEICELRIGLLEEELAEYEMARALNDRVDMLDALCDLQYVLSGAVLHFGVREYLNRALTNYPSGRVASWSLARATLRYLGNDTRRGFTELVAVDLVEFQKALSQRVYMDGFSEVFEAAFLAVHENNYAKVWDGEDDMLMNVRDDLTFTPCEWKPGYYIARNALGKIIKPPGHKKVDLTKFVK